jgi:formate dehydrogenase subunit gamma
MRRIAFAPMAAAVAAAMAALVALIVVATAPAAPVLAQQQPQAQQAPMARTSATEAEIFRQIRQGQQGYVSIPDKKAGVLVQSEGETWRNLRNGPISTYGAWLLLGMVVVIAVFFAVRGRIRIERGPAGRTIRRFNAVERFAHWLTAASFIVLALTGLNMLYGRYVLLPLIGASPFAALTLYGKMAHNYIAAAFVLGVLMMLALWVRHNIPNGDDLKWLAKGGGLFTKGVHPPSRKFNAGQKFIFWSVVIGGGILTVTGFYLMLPFDFGMTIYDMQQFVVWHGIAGLVLIAIVIGHIYIGSIGMEGAFDAMGTGEVDENWAREHHNLWVAELKGEAKGGHDD